MIKKILVLVLLSLVVIPLFAGAEETKPVQLAAFNPVQLVPEQDSIKGLRLSLFYTVNKDGGVGPMTVAMLMKNTLKAFRLQTQGRANIL